MFYQLNFKHPERYKQNYYLYNALDLINTMYYGGVYYSKVDTVILTEPTGAARSAYRYTGNLLFDEVAPTSANNSFKTRGLRSGEAHDYFFSDDFYKGASTLPHEKFIFDFFRDQVIEKKTLIGIIENYWNLTPTQRCYMAGIYVLAIRISLSTTYKYL